MYNSKPVFIGIFVGKMLHLKNDSSITLSGEQIESMDMCDLESVIEEVMKYIVRIRRYF